MSTLNFKSLNKVYDNNVQAVFDFNLDIKDKEFIVLVGPSGCGKSTTLRMVAGLEEITTGELYIDNVLVNNVEPKDRNIAMVFQNYALYPHMTVYENMAFALKLRKIPCPVYESNLEANLLRKSDMRLMHQAKAMRRKGKKARIENKKKPYLDDVYYASMRKKFMEIMVEEDFAKEMDKLGNLSKEEYAEKRTPFVEKKNAELAEIERKYQNSLKEINDKKLVIQGKINASDAIVFDFDNKIDYSKFEIYTEVDKIYERIINNEDKVKALLEDTHIKGIYEEKIKEIEKQLAYTKKDLNFFAKAKEKGGYNETSTKIIEDGLAQRTSQLASFEKQLEYYKTTEVPLYKSRKLTRFEMDLEINKAARILDLTRYLLRKPAALSGGQRQRVALGRCIVRNPKVFLMDEPLSNLDAKLRVQTRSEIINIHQRVNATTIYVTHDQTEAMTMADRIVVMKDGYVQQIGVPDVIYDDPTNIFVAGFIGNPPMNFLNATIDNEYVIITKEGEKTQTKIKLKPDQKEILKPYDNKPIVLGIRPEAIKLEGDSKLNKDAHLFDIDVNFKELLGYENVLYTKIEEQKFLVKIDNSKKVTVGEKVTVGFNLESLYFFDKETTNRIK